jgi:hypothetical protein
MEKQTKEKLRTLGRILTPFYSMEDPSSPNRKLSVDQSIANLVGSLALVVGIELGALSYYMSNTNPRMGMDSRVSIERKDYSVGGWRYND